jgi:hypothetical protein
MLEIKTADELIEPELEARWAARRAGPHAEVLQHVLRAFVDRGGPIAVDEIAAALPDRAPEAVREVGYPFSAVPTPFVVRLADGRERYACCAIDALGIAPMLGQRVHIRSQCHHCGAPLELSADPGGPGPEAHGVMVWVGKRTGGQRRIATSL